MTNLKSGGIPAMSLSNRTVNTTVTRKQTLERWIRLTALKSSTFDALAVKKRWNCKLEALKSQKSQNDQGEGVFEMETLNLQLKIYLPTIYNPLDHFQRDLLLKLTKTFGGATIYPNNYGTWLKTEKDGEAKVIHDKITVIEIFTTKAFYNTLNGEKDFLDAVKSIKEHFNQNCVAYTVNGKMRFY